jgi:hypothetical protein
MAITLLTQQFVKIKYHCHIKRNRTISRTQQAFSQVAGMAASCNAFASKDDGGSEEVVMVERTRRGNRAGQALAQRAEPHRGQHPVSAPHAFVRKDLANVARPLL